MVTADFAHILREKYLKNTKLDDYTRTTAYAEILHTGERIEQIFFEHDNILISVSGGSDSDCIVHLICVYFREYIEKCNFVFVDTGLEYAATKRHIDYLQEKYGIKIKKIRGKSVVWAVRNYGVPILSKSKSQLFAAYCRGAKWAVNYANGGEKSHKYTLNPAQRRMLDFIKTNGIKISDMCCKVSKKQPIADYIKNNAIDLNVTGERMAEGGFRSMSHKSCFETGKKTSIIKCDKFMPLFWWSDSTKKVFKELEGIHFSDCYEVWGMKRTGCVGCPFNRKVNSELQLIRTYEPKLYIACMSVFGEAYRLVEMFGARKYTPRKKR